MKVIDLTPEHEKQYFCCLEDWSDDIKEAGDHKACWYNRMKDNGLRVKLAQDDNGVIGGMIQYMPVENSFIEGKDLYVVLCIWIHGHKQGIGNFQKKGMGKALLAAAEEDVKTLGAKGLAAWGLIIPVFMRASWFKKHGYKVADKDSLMRLLWKPFTKDAVPPAFIKLKKKPVLVPGKVNVNLFLNGWCPAQNVAYERTKRAIEDFKDKIELNEYHTIDKNIQKEWGINDAIFIEKKQLWTGPPPSYNKIRKLIERQVRRIS